MTFNFEKRPLRSKDAMITNIKAMNWDQDEKINLSDRFDFSVLFNRSKKLSDRSNVNKHTIIVESNLCPYTGSTDFILLLKSKNCNCRQMIHRIRDRKCIIFILETMHINLFAYVTLYQNERYLREQTDFKSILSRLHFITFNTRLINILN